MNAALAPRGSLEHASLPAILRSLTRSQRTGVLRLQRSRHTKTVYVSEGRLIFATSTDPDDRLGEMLLRKGLISYRALEESVRGIQVGKRQGTLLVESGAIRSRHLVEGSRSRCRRSSTACSAGARAATSSWRASCPRAR